jgi:hypothetical protein
MYAQSIGTAKYWSNATAKCVARSLRMYVDECCMCPHSEMTRPSATFLPSITASASRQHDRVEQVRLANLAADTGLTRA